MIELENTEKIAVKDPITVWKSCLLKIKESVSMMTYNTWFLPIKPVELIDSTLKVQIPSQFFWEWIDEHFNVLITKAITEILAQSLKHRHAWMTTFHWGAWQMPVRLPGLCFSWPTMIRAT